MAADFPASIPVIVRVLPTDMMDGAGTEADVLHNDLADEVEALATVIGVTGSIVPTTVEARITALQGSSTPETASTIGTLIAGSSDKATPVDADNIAISDSAAANILKRLSWANVKTALASVFARLAGTAGGQTIIGGTAAGENLTLQSTSNATKGAIIFGTASKYDHANDRLGLGTLTPTAKVHALATTEQLRLGYDASNYVSTTVSATGLVTIAGTLGQYSLAGPTDAQATATLGTELITNPSFASDLSGWTAGSGWSWAAGGALHAAGNTATLDQGVAVTNGSTYQLEIAISGRTAGSIAVALGAVSVIESGSSTAFTSTLSRTVVAGATGTVSLAITPTTDFNGTVDSVSLKLVTLGSFPAVMRFPEGGVGAVEIRQSLVRANTSIGRDSGRSITTGSNNSNVGVNAGRGITTGSNNSNFGQAAGRYLADGSTALTTPTNCVFLGSSTKASADGVTAENVFGYNAIGIGSNTTCIGASSNTKTQIYGDIILDKTVTAAGTTGAQTINKTCGSVNFRAGDTSLVVTDSRVTTASVIVATVATNDTTMKTVLVVAAAGSFTITANAAATAETRVNFIVIN